MINNKRPPRRFYRLTVVVFFFFYRRFVVDFYRHFPVTGANYIRSSTLAVVAASIFSYRTTIVNALVHLYILVHYDVIHFFSLVVYCIA